MWSFLNIILKKKKKIKNPHELKAMQGEGEGEEKLTSQNYVALNNGPIRWPIESMPQITFQSSTSILVFVDLLAS